MAAAPVQAAAGPLREFKKGTDERRDETPCEAVQERLAALAALGERALSTGGLAERHRWARE